MAPQGNVAVRAGVGAAGVGIAITGASTAATTAAVVLVATGGALVLAAVAAAIYSWRARRGGTGESAPPKEQRPVGPRPAQPLAPPCSDTQVR
jgi:hypothetical protein